MWEEGGAARWRQCRQLHPRDSGSDAKEWSLLEDVVSAVSGTGCDFNSSFYWGRPVTSSTALASDSGANSADVCAERTCHKDTMTQSRWYHKEDATVLQRKPGLLVFRSIGLNITQSIYVPCMKPVCLDPCFPAQHSFGHPLCWGWETQRVKIST